MGGKLEECMKLFEESEDNIINGRSESGWTALCNASEKGHFAIVKWLVANGAKLNGKTNLGETSLMHACMSGKMDVLLFLIAEGADVKIKNIDYKNLVELATTLRE
jgi:ankyrin repeat protein